MSAGKKIGLGFGALMALLTVVAVIGYTSMSNMLNNTHHTIKMNELDKLLVEKEVDHLNWANAVSELLTNENVTELKVQTDDHQCAFGKWLYGEERVQTEQAMPELASILKEIEPVHERLHASAIHIGESFHQADPELPGVLAARQIDHLNWANAVRDAFLNKSNTLEVQTDATKCALGQWLESEQAKKAYANGDAEFKRAWDEMLTVHRQLHASVIDVKKNLAFDQVEQARQTRQRTLNELDKISQSLFQELDQAMETFVDPAKAKAEKAKDIESMTKWSAIDMALNEDIIEPLLSLRILLNNTYESKQKSAYKEAYNEILASVDEWAKLLQNDSAMEKVADSIRKHLEDWNAQVIVYFGAADEEEKYLATLDTARKTFQDTMLPALEQTLAHLHTLTETAQNNLNGMAEANRVFNEVTKPSLTQTQELLTKAIDLVTANVEKENEGIFITGKRSKALVGVISFAALLIGIILAYFIARSITRALKQIIEGLRLGADQVTSASGQVAQSSQSMAEGASEQASSLEEISSSLEEMASMTRQNADNSRQVNKMATEARTSTDQGREAMARMSEAIGKIKAS
ncbi:CZB domain-containing protein, partial [Candidatus Sumerlaeota bacterium]|nr:CZB domain-containing protein [Candidatus Sumerlaeota bacterium]